MQEKNQINADGYRIGYWEEEGFYSSISLHRSLYSKASKAHGVYIDGTRNGIWQFFSRNDVLVFEATFDIKKRGYHGMYKKFNSDGNVNAEVLFIK